MVSADEAEYINTSKSLSGWDCAMGASKAVTAQAGMGCFVGERYLDSEPEDLDKFLYAGLADLANRYPETFVGGWANYSEGDLYYYFKQTAAKIVFDEARYGLPEFKSNNFAFYRIDKNGHEEFITARPDEILYAVTTEQLTSWSKANIVCRQVS